MSRWCESRMRHCLWCMCNLYETSLGLVRDAHHLNTRPLRDSHMNETCKCYETWETRRVSAVWVIYMGLQTKWSRRWITQTADPSRVSHMSHASHMQHASHMHYTDSRATSCLSCLISFTCLTHMCIHIAHVAHVVKSWHGVATMSRLLKIICLFCKRAL